jgi:hypothetical protein
MTCTVNLRSEGIDLRVSEVVFTLKCDDDRVIIVTGEYFERFSLPEILSQIGAQLANATIEIQRS